MEEFCGVITTTKKKFLNEKRNGNLENNSAQLILKTIRRQLPYWLHVPQTILIMLSLLRIVFKFDFLSGALPLELKSKLITKNQF